MRRRTLAVAAMLVSLTGAASAHRLDDYLQATLIAVDQDHVELSTRLVPGIAVSAAVIANIDSNGDGALSEAERRDYAVRFLSGLSLSLDGRRLEPALVSADFPTLDEMRDGLGEIHIESRAALPEGGGERRLVLENRNRMQKAVYLVNALAPSDPAISIVAQKRDQTQSTYELDYRQAGAPTGWWSQTVDSMEVLGLPSLFALGARHIAEGTDHLLFLLVLLLPAPLLAAGSRWNGPTDVRSSLRGILKIVTAFTVGHSITLALAAFGVLHVPSRPVEVLIAVSILVSAIHALRPVFPGREAAIAAFFGLIHGLAFASTLNELGLGRWERLAGILAFNLGIETMQMTVVAATLPSLILMSRTPAYPWLRVVGAVVAGAAAVGWIGERILGAPSAVDAAVNELAQRSVWIAGGLFLLSAGCWALPRLVGAGAANPRPTANLT